MFYLLRSPWYECFIRSVGFFLEVIVKALVDEINQVFYMQFKMKNSSGFHLITFEFALTFITKLCINELL